MNWLIYHIVGGTAFFVGLALLLGAVLLRTGRSRRAGRVATWGVLLGVIALVASATALPFWAYGVILSAVVAAPFAKRAGTQRAIVSAASALALVGVGLHEARHHVMPVLQPSPIRRVAVIGDSITAGYGASDTTTKWPSLLRELHRVDVQDLSRIGETAGSAAEILREHPVDAPVVVLEIGGNDLLGTTTPELFERTLDSLLAGVCKPGRQLVMFELPLPPLYERYGRVQRALARKHGVALLPKRILLSVIADEDGTVDSIHLTQQGHDRMAALVWATLRPAMPPEP